MNKLSAGLLLSVLIALSGCARQQSTGLTVPLPVRQVQATGLSPQPLGFYTDRLAVQLFNPVSGTENQWRHAIAVSSFLPVRQLTLEDSNSQQIDLANQLAESMLTAAVQRGYHVIDLRLRAAVLLKADHEQGFSRLLSELQHQHQARTLLSGTYAPQEDGVVVNVRLIDIQTQQVLAAATDYIPDNVTWSAEKMLKRGNYLYRSDRIGEKP